MSAAPHELTVEEIRGVVDAFAAAAQRARRMGLDLVELHSAHGYLLHQFLSPLSNKRTDRYGGSLENRTRAPLEVARAVREAWPRERALGARITASDWTAGGFEVQDAVAYARELKAVGLDYVCVSSGGVVNAPVKVAPGYQVGFAEQVKRGAGLPVMAGGMIADPQQAEDIVSGGRADMVALARGLLDDPRWPWHAAERLGVKLALPPQYALEPLELLGVCIAASAAAQPGTLALVALPQRNTVPLGQADQLLARHLQQSAVGRIGRAGLSYGYTDILGGIGRDNQEDVWGVILTPSYFLILNKLQAVLRYHYAHGDDSGLNLQKRYEALAPEIQSTKGAGSDYNAIYLGLNYYVYRHNLKLMTGIEYNDMTGGKQSFSGWTCLAGVRLAF